MCTVASPRVNRSRRAFSEALDELGSSKPIVVRFDGNAAVEGLNILAQAGRANLHVAQTMEEATQQAARFAAKEVR